MWAHAHGLIKLYQHGHLQMDEAQFRATYLASGARMMMGMATDEYRNEIARELEAETAAAGV